MLRIPRRTLALAVLVLPLGARAANPPAASPPPASAPSPLGANDIARHVDDYYNRVTSFKASFKQRYVAPAYNKTKDSTGSVIFEKPGKMSWRYANNGNRVVSDGTLLKIYEKDSNQLYEQPLSKTAYPAALSFLVGQGHLLKSFSFQSLNAQQMKFPSGYVLEGVPLQPTPAYQRVFFYVDAQTFQVRRVLMVDAQGNRNRFDFSAAVSNVRVPAGEFTFKPPANAVVIRPGVGAGSVGSAPGP